MLCRKLVLLLLCSCLACIVFAQTEALHNAVRNDLLSLANKINAWPLLEPVADCPNVLQATTDNALQTATDAIAVGNWVCCERIFSSLANKKESLSALNKLRLSLATAAYYNAHQQYDTAKKIALTVNETAGQMNRTNEKAQALLILADAGLRTRDISAAYRWADTALQLSRELHDRQLEGCSLLQMGLCTRRNFTAYAQRSFPYYQGAAAAAEEAGDSLTLFMSHMYTAIDYFELNDAQTAMPFLQKAVAVAQNLRNLRAAYIVCVGVAYALEQVALPRQALPLYRKALALTTRADLPYSKQNAYTFIGGVFRKEKQYDSALAYANLVASVQGVDSLYSNSWDLKANIYRESGDYKAAADAFVKAMDWEAENSLYRSQNQLSGYEASLKTKEKDLQVEQEKKRSIHLQWIAIGTAVLLLFALLAYLLQQRTQRKLSAQKELIEKQRNELEASLSEKEILLKEIHHRVKNNLMTISSLLDLQADSTGSIEAKEAIAEGQNRIRSIALIHQRLYQQADLAAVDFGAFVSDLVNEILRALKKPGQKLTTTVDVPKTLLDIDTAVPLSLILNELLTNSFKHAFAIEKEGRIQIRLSPPADGQYILTYTDNGPGLPAHFDLKRNTSLGLRLIYRLAKQVSGEARFQNEDRSFVIFFKDSATRNNEA